MHPLSSAHRHVSVPSPASAGTAANVALNRPLARGRGHQQLDHQSLDRRSTRSPPREEDLPAQRAGITHLAGNMNLLGSRSPSTAIGLGKYRIPSDLRSQAEYRLVSTMVGDHMGILGAVVSFWPGMSIVLGCSPTALKHHMNWGVPSHLGLIHHLPICLQGWVCSSQWMRAYRVYCLLSARPRTNALCPCG